MHLPKSRYGYFLFMGGLLILVAAAASSQSTTSAPMVTVYKQPT
ncbi:MAG TPA: hypothetical protein VE616_15240 [Candidatus Udaeobacter sp.]|jgi:hypothetical protein|nr:hypothetical protein [Candidatus Udaeobacter sp.]